MSQSDLTLPSWIQGRDFLEGRLGTLVKNMAPNSVPPATSASLEGVARTTKVRIRRRDTGGICLRDLSGAEVANTHTAGVVGMPSSERDSQSRNTEKRLGCNDRRGKCSRDRVPSCSCRKSKRAGAGIWDGSWDSQGGERRWGRRRWSIGVGVGDHRRKISARYRFANKLLYHALEHSEQRVVASVFFPSTGSQQCIFEINQEIKSLPLDDIVRD